MKLLRCTIFMMIAGLALMAQPAPKTGLPTAHRTRVALALSGGGSLGLAHIGVLEYFEEHHIPVDAIAGTSIGGIVGGLYATGHTPAEMESSFTAVDWDEMLRVQPRYRDLPMAAREERARAPGEYVLRLGRGLSLPAGLSTAEALDLFLSRQVLAYSAVEDFGALPTPFRCVATQLETGEAFVLRRGNLARALRATMAVPGIFTPVEWDGHVLVDGGLVDNLPTDVAREMGADVVVAVHFSTPLPPAKQLQSLPNVLTQAVSVAVSVTERENLRSADLVLAPSLVGIGGIDYRHAHELIERGYQAAAQKQRFLATLALSDEEWAAYQAERRSRMKPAPGPVKRLVADSRDEYLARYAQAGLNHGDGPVTVERIEAELSKLVTASALPGAFYRLTPSQPETMTVELEPRTGSQIFVRPALELAVANGGPARGRLLGFVTVIPQEAYRARYRIQFAVGYSPRVEVEYERPLGASEWFWTPAVTLQREDSTSYAGGQHLAHWRDTYAAALDFGYGLSGRWRVRAGVEAGYEQLAGVQFPGALASHDGAYVAPRMRAEWNNLDEPSLPKRGTMFTSTMEERYRSGDGRVVPLGRARVEQYAPMLGGTLTASADGGTSFGRALNYYDLFALGGSAGLRGLHFEQFHATWYGAGEVSYRRPFGKLKLMGERPQFGTWYEAARFTQPAQARQSAQSGSVGVLLNSPLGVLTFAIGRTSDGQTRGRISVGRP